MRGAVVAGTGAILCAAASGQALVLISRDAAGPNIDPRAYVHPTWVRWPVATDPRGGNLALALKTGFAWNTGPNLLDFREAPGGFRSLGHAELLRRGAFDHDRPVPRLVADPGEPLRRETMLLAVGKADPVVTVDRTDSRSGPVVAWARSWDRATELAKRHGRALVVEWPTGGARWSRFWTLGDEWPKETSFTGRDAVDGVVRAEEAWDLIERPVSFAGGSPERFGGANRLVDSANGGNSPFLGGLFLAVSLLLARGAMLVADERRSALVATGLRLLFHAIPAATLAGAARRAGWGDGSAVIAALWPLAATAIGAACGRRIPAILTDAVLVLGALAVGGARWSILGPIFGARPFAIAPETAASAVLAGAVLAASHRAIALAVTIGSVAIAFLGGEVGMLALLVPLSVLRGRWMGLAVAQPEPLARWREHGGAWRPYDLLSERADANRLDVSALFFTLASPAMAATLSLALILGFALPRFFWRQARRILAEPRVAGAGRASIGLILAGFFVPEAFAAAPLALLGTAALGIWTGLDRLDRPEGG